MGRQLREWLIFKLVGDQPVIMNIDVQLGIGVCKMNKTLLTKNSNFC